MKPYLIALLLPLAACGTVSVEGKIRDSLVAAGVKEPMARCLAGKLSKKLSYAQLEKLRDAMRARPEHSGHIKLPELIARLDAIGDPEITATVTRAGISCTFKG